MLRMSTEERIALEISHNDISGHVLLFVCYLTPITAAFQLYDGLYYSSLDQTIQ